MIETKRLENYGFVKFSTINIKQKIIKNQSKRGNIVCESIKQKP